MKKKKLIFIVFVLLFTVSCSSASFGDFTRSFFGEKLVNLTPEEQFEKKMREYKLEATLHTTKGDINIILYPDAAPQNVKQFVELAKKGFYDGLTFHRVIPSTLIQTGDNKGDGTGNSGVFVKDEFVDWLDFKSLGMVGMANIPNVKNSNSSQIFITLTSIPQFDNNYTIIGELSTRDDLSRARLIRSEDKIKSITISGINVDDFLNNFNK